MKESKNLQTNTNKYTYRSSLYTRVDDENRTTKFFTIHLIDDVWRVQSNIVSHPNRDTMNVRSNTYWAWFISNLRSWIHPAHYSDYNIALEMLLVRIKEFELEGSVIELLTTEEFEEKISKLKDFYADK